MNLPPLTEGEAEEDLTISNLQHYFRNRHIGDHSFQYLLFTEAAIKSGVIVDTGNTVGNSMDYDLYKKLGIKMEPLEKLVGTAAKDEPITIIGKTEPIQFSFMQGKKIFTERFYVIKGLNGGVNLGKEFLSKHKAKHNHETETITIGNERVHMLNRADSRNSDTRVQGRIFSLQKVRIPANSARYVPVQVPLLKGKCIVQIEPATDTVLPIARSISNLQAKTTMISVFNPFNKDIDVE